MAKKSRQKRKFWQSSVKFFLNLSHNFWNILFFWCRDDLKSWRKVLNLFKAHKKTFFVGPSTLFFILVIFLVIFFNRNKVSQGQKQGGLKTNSAIVVSTPTEKRTTVTARRLDGLLVSTTDDNKLPLCVMIDNAAFGGTRPQSGLSRALVVYEIIVEGGITRFMAVYGGEEAQKIGPIRSSRDSFLEFASEYNCPFFHAGGSYTALQALETFKMRYVDALREPYFFWRDSSKYNPHNLFSSTEKLNQAAKNHHWLDEEAPSFSAWNFVDNDSIKGSEAQELKINFGGAYSVSYLYNSKGGYYERTQGGVLQTDESNGEILSAKNIVLQFVGEGIYIEGKGRVNWPVTGEGEVVLLHSGKMERGVWRRENRTSRTFFLSLDDQQLNLIRGNIWVEVIPPHISVNF